MESWFNSNDSLLVSVGKQTLGVEWGRLFFSFGITFSAGLDLPRITYQDSREPKRAMGGEMLFQIIRLYFR